jgi:hypothetical protein
LHTTVHDVDKRHPLPRAACRTQKHQPNRAVFDVQVSAQLIAPSKHGPLRQYTCNIIQYLTAHTLHTKLHRQYELGCVYLHRHHHIDHHHDTSTCHIIVESLTTFHHCNYYSLNIIFGVELHTASGSMFSRHALGSARASLHRSHNVELASAQLWWRGCDPRQALIHLHRQNQATRVLYGLQRTSTSSSHI